MKSLRLFLLSLSATLVVAFGLSGPALAAGSWGGPGSSFNISTYGTTSTGFLPSAPGSVPAGSTITGVGYNFDWTSPGFASGSMSISLCVSGTSNCTTAYQFNNSTTYFNGLPANTSFVFKASFNKVGQSGKTISGGPLKVTDSISVSYT